MTVRLPASTMRQLRQQAEYEEVTVAEVLREWLEAGRKHIDSMEASTARLTGILMGLSLVLPGLT